MEGREWIWYCTKRLVELHAGDPMELDDWERVATELRRSAGDGDTPQRAAEAYATMRASAP